MRYSRQWDIIIIKKIHKINKLVENNKLCLTKNYALISLLNQTLF